MIATENLWIRGVALNFSQRLKMPTYSGKHMWIVTALILVTGMGIYYHTNMLNTYSTKADKVVQRISYEKTYSSFKAIAQPRLINTTLQVELYPDERKAIIQARQQFVNKSNHNIDSVLLNISDEVKTTAITIQPKSKRTRNDNDSRCMIYLLEKPLQPMDTLSLTYTLHHQPAYFSNEGVATNVMDNGTFISNSDWFPTMGYQLDQEIHGTKLRQHYGLPERQLSSSDSITTNLQQTAERINFEAVIGTVSDQIAVTSGQLVKTWDENGRRYYHYQADHPILDIFDLYSARYAVQESNWRDVTITIFHHPDHTLNITKFEQAAKASLEYYTSNFGAYPSHQLTLVEHTDPGIGGISLPGCIGYSSNFALLHLPSTDNPIDLPFAVMAHEIAHQWWGHQVVPDKIAGGVFLSESLAWYSALCVVEQSLGEDALHQLLNAMRRSFIHPRTRANVSLLEADNYFLAYRKGPLTMYALKEYMGEATINETLKNLISRSEGNESYLATAHDFYHHLIRSTPDTLHYLIDDLLRYNTFWELEAKRVDILSVEDGYETTLEVVAKKLTVDEHNTVKEIEMVGDWIEVGVETNSEAAGQYSYLQKHLIKTGTNTITILTKEKPSSAGIDPRNLLMDTKPENNVQFQIL